MEGKAYIHFFDELNDFLTNSMRDNRVIYLFKDTPSIKHVIEALGVPHTEVGRIVINGLDVGFDYPVKNEDNVQVFPISFLLFASLSYPKYVLDNHLGKLATYLRILGFDTLYDTKYNDDELAEISQNSNRILLTRDRRLLMRSVITRGYWVRALEPKQQLFEVIKRYQLSNRINPFRRCLRCNSYLEAIKKEEIFQRLEPLTRKYYNEFSICRNCNRLYWKGSHYEHMNKMITELKQMNLWRTCDE